MANISSRLQIQIRNLLAVTRRRTSNVKDKNLKKNVGNLKEEKMNNESFTDDNVAVLRMRQCDLSLQLKRENTETGEDANCQKNKENLKTNKT